MSSPGFNCFQKTTSRFLKAVAYKEAHDKLKCIGHPLPRSGTDWSPRDYEADRKIPPTAVGGIFLKRRASENNLTIPESS
ncbi:MAG TPA: hypothetical protein VL866_06400 [Pyrinomonadaceae bacterium]|nr:hypothetical protein [Pyrinomonadaceae bacterium]